MRKEKTLYIILAVLFVTYVIVEFYSPKPIDWTVTYSDRDKNPYGSFILYEQLDDFFSDKSVSFQTLYESKDSNEHQIILATHFDPSAADIESIYSILDQGSSILIAAENFSEEFLEAHQISMEYHPLQTISEDSTEVKMAGQTIYVPSAFIGTSFEIDSSTLWKIHAKAQGPVLIEKKYPSAKLILSSIPHLFTNYGLLNDENYRYAEAALRLIPQERITYNRFYLAGKQEPATPLRYVLSQAPLRWAVYLTLVVLMLYLIVGSRRIQRVIPVIKPLQNTTINYIKTIGGLYHREGDHKNVALKMIHHFTKMMGLKYYIHILDESSYKNLAAKSGVTLEDVIKTFELIQVVKQSRKISEATLKQLYEKMNLFKIN